MIKKEDHPLYERTLVLIKPDGVMRGIIGEVIARFERRGLKLIALKMVRPTREHVDKHYQETEEWLTGIGQKTYDTFEQFGWNVKDRMGTDDKKEIGKMVKEWLVEYLLEGPVVAMIIEGMHAVTTVRKMVGNTVPINAEPGTIRGDYSVDANSAANADKRTLKNVVHASGSIAEAEFEIGHWFAAEEIHDYVRGDAEVMFGKLPA